MKTPGYDRAWTIRVGTPGKHILYFSGIFHRRKDAQEEINKYKSYAKQNHWKIVELVEKK